MLRPDPDLPFLDVAWSPPEMQEVFNRDVLPRLGLGSDVTDVVIEDMTYWPRKRCVVLYAIRFGDASGRRSTRAVATFAADARLSRKTRSGAAVFVPELRCLVELFPQDCRLPGLGSLTDVGEVALHLSKRGMTAALSSTRREVHTLQYRPHQRCVLRYPLKSVDGHWPGDVIGKVYPRLPKATQAWRAHTFLDTQSMSGITTPKPLCLLGDLNVVLMEHVEGKPLKEVLNGAVTGEITAENAARRLAAAMVALHGTTFPGQEIETLQTRMQLFRSRTFNLHHVAPSLAQQVDTQLERIAALAEGCLLPAPACIHGECKSSQFVMVDGRMVMLDFDRACLGDPAIDVGHFMAAVHREAMEGARIAARDIAGAFLDAYLERSPDRGLETRSRLFQAASLVRMAVRSLTQRPYLYRDGSDESIPVRLLDEATACLAAPSRV